MLLYIAQGLHLKAGVYISQIEDDFMLKAGDILTQVVPKWLTRITVFASGCINQSFVD